MADETTRDHGIIASYVDPKALEPRVRAALEGLGYEFVQASTMGRFDETQWRPQIRLVNSGHLDRIPSCEIDPSTPIILLDGERQDHVDDPRVIGRIPRPAALSDLYPLLQRCLEPTPRGAPRIDTELAARAAGAERRWFGHLTSLSATGCHLRAIERIAIGTRLNLEFVLPPLGLVMVRAKCMHHSSDGIGLRFDEADAPVQSAIDAFVARRLATISALAPLKVTVHESSGDAPRTSPERDKGAA